MFSKKNKTKKIQECFYAVTFNGRFKKKSQKIWWLTNFLSYFR